MTPSTNRRAGGLNDATARLATLRNDLRSEHEALHAMVRDLSDADGHRSTPAEGWSVRDQISHLCYFDETATLALTNPAAFQRHAAELLAQNGKDRSSFPDVVLGRRLSTPVLLDRWHSARGGLLRAAAGVAPEARIPWYALPMSPASFVTARLMETWAHGQDIVDALGLEPIVSDRLRHVCHIGIAARPFAFMIHGIDDPGAPVRVEVGAPNGNTWTWGPPDASNRIEGSALDLALVVTQRRHVADTDLTPTGATATAWISIAQAFAGAAGTGRSPGLRRLRQ